VGAGEGLRIFEECRAHAARVGATSIGEEAKYGAAHPVRPRLGQGIFRLSINAVYHGACAVTEEHSLPALEAAHIRPFAGDGTHDIENGLLLRSDIHRLFDRGYVTVTPAYRFEVSRRLKEDFSNGRTYYPLHGRQIAVPERQEERPAPAHLAWHNANVFLG
jgi:putative restriction endonuclease